MGYLIAPRALEHPRLLPYRLRTAPSAEELGQGFSVTHSQLNKKAPTGVTGLELVRLDDVSHP